MADTIKLKSTLAIRRAEKLFRNAIDDSPIMICCSGPEGTATFFNKSWLRFTGQTMDQELGSGWLDGLHPDDREQTAASIASSFDSRSDCYVQYRLRRAEGQYRSMLCSGLPRLSPGGDFLGYIAVCSDIGEVPGEQGPASIRPARKNSGLLTRGLTHDLSGLLKGILGLTDVALSERMEGLDVDARLRGIRVAALRGGELVRELAVHADHENATRQFDLVDLIQEMLPLLRILIPKHVMLTFGTDTDLAVVQGNPGRLLQVLMRLVMRGSQALAEREGTIHLNAAFVPAAELPAAVSDLARGDQVQLEIRVTHPGMTGGSQAGLFDPGSLSADSAACAGASTMAQTILREQDAAVQVVNTAGSARFQIWLPGAGKSPALAAVRRVPGVNQSSRVRSVLVVDDEDILRLAVAKVLRKRGFSVLEAHEGRSALELAQHPDAIDVLLLDAVLPGMSSRTVLEEILRLRPGLKVIITSAQSEETAMVIFDGLRSDQFLTKPFRTSELMASLEEVLA